MAVRKVAVVGAGTMGAGIAQVCACAGLDVAMRDVSEETVARGLAAVAKGLERLVSKDRKTGRGFYDYT